MPGMRRLGTASIVTFALAAAVPAAADATLVFDKGANGSAPSVYAAADDGTTPRRIGGGSQPDLSPDGRTVAFQGRDYARPELLVSPTASAAARVLLRDFRGFGRQLAWSPDSRFLATTTGPEIGTRALKILEVATGATTRVATGFFSGVSFSPDGASLVYARGPRDEPRFDLHRFDLATGRSSRLTTGLRSQSPRWGSRAIVFTRQVDAGVRRFGPKGELYTLDPATKAVRRLTNQKVASLLFGLTATQFSADGTRLLAQFGGQDTSFTQVVNPATGRVRTLGRATEAGYLGYALSADGRTVLAATGGFDPGARHDVVSVPYAGGRPTVLIRDAFSADWDR